MTDMPDKTKQGIIDKFRVYRVDGSDAPGSKHDGCTYFVLDRDHDPFARAALLAYAKACEKEYPTLAADLRVDVRDRPLKASAHTAATESAAPSETHEVGLPSRSAPLPSAPDARSGELFARPSSTNEVAQEATARDRGQCEPERADPAPTERELWERCAKVLGLAFRDDCYSRTRGKPGGKRGAKFITRTNDPRFVYEKSHGAGRSIALDKLEALLREAADAADMMLDGTLCVSCGVYIEEGEPDGIPRNCGDCAKENPNG